MTDRHLGYTVALDRDIREDDAEHIINAIRLIKGVSDVKPIRAEPLAQAIAMRVKADIRQRVLDEIDDT